ncbi:MAG: ribosomal-protein-alanine N-acetyltransferase, partial [Cupriavidus sp.]|nr:ribosomal-protein-alanine N-acetyltransferase [Cupriavidus sp.]
MSAALLPAERPEHPEWPTGPVMPALAPGWAFDHMSARDLPAV